MKSAIASVGVIVLGSTALLSPAQATTWAFKDQHCSTCEPVQYHRG